jgi:restriction system protein
MGFRERVAEDMPRRHSMTFYKPRRRSRRSSRGNLGIVGVLLVLFLLLVVLRTLILFLQTPTGLIFAILVIGAVIVYFVFRRRYQNKQSQAWLIHQQQQTVWQFHQQQEAAIQFQQKWERQQREEQDFLAELRAEEERDRQEIERYEKERIARMKSLGDILVLTPKEFEELTGRILEANGFHDVQIVGGSGDLGVDLFAWDQVGYKYAVQCKRYAPGNTVGSPAIQTFFGMMFHHQVHKGIFVTTSSFSQPAVDLANQRDIRLINGNQLIDLMKNLQQTYH